MINVWLGLDLDVGEPDLHGLNLLKGWGLDHHLISEGKPSHLLEETQFCQLFFSTLSSLIVSTSLQTPTCPSLFPHLWSRSWDTWTPRHTEATHSNPRWELHPLWTKKCGSWTFFSFFKRICLNRSAQHGQPAVWTKSGPNPVRVN